MGTDRGADVDAALRAGVAVYNAGHYHAAHDAWEDRWLALESGTADERLLHGLIQFTAAVHHARRGNRSGARGLAESAGGYLADLSADHRGVNLADVRPSLERLAADPGRVERESPPPLTVRSAALRPADLDLDAALAAAPALAGASGLDEEPVERAVAFARADLADGDEGSRFVRFLLDFVRDADARGIVHQRLSEHVSRRRSREEDVEGLFE